MDGFKGTMTRLRL